VKTIHNFWSLKYWKNCDENYSI